jgi:hypothetical protein
VPTPQLDDEGMGRHRYGFFSGEKVQYESFVVPGLACVLLVVLLALLWCVLYCRR